MNYIYLIQTRECVNLKEPTYKIGKTTQEPNKRLRSYGPGYEQIIVRKVINCDIIEKKIITEFKSTFEQMRKYGIEYFKGDKNKMIKIINTIIDKEELNNVIDKEEINNHNNSDNGIFAIGVVILGGIFLIGKTILQKTSERKTNKK